MADKFVYDFSLVLVTLLSLGLSVALLSLAFGLTKSLYMDIKKLIQEFRKNN